MTAAILLDPIVSEPPRSEAESRAQGTLGALMAVEEHEETFSGFCAHGNVDFLSDSGEYNTEKGSNR